MYGQEVAQGSTRSAETRRRMIRRPPWMARRPKRASGTAHSSATATRTCVGRSGFSPRF